MNPRFGRDEGFLPPGAPFAGQMPMSGQPYIPHQGMNAGYSWFGSMQPQPFGTAPQPYYYGMQPQYQPHAYMPNGANNAFVRNPGGVPNLNPQMPSAQMSNSTGGTGCEPGYNYFFAAEHTKIHVFKSSTPPWQLPQNAQIPFHAAHVPVNTTCADILKGFGATNPNPKKNFCYEIAQGGNGKWYKGLCIAGDDKAILKKEIKELGWDKTRTGKAGEKPVVYIWLTKGEE